MRYRTVAEAYRDLEEASGRLALVDRLAVLLAETPAELLPAVCYLCQGLIAPEFAGVDLGPGREARRPRGGRRGRRRPGAGRRPACGRSATWAWPRSSCWRRPPTDRPAALTVTDVVDTLHQIAAASGAGSQGRKLELLAGLLGRATPLEARYLLRLVTKGLRLGIGTPTILDALAQVYAGGRAARPVLERGLQHLLRPGAGCRRPGRGRAGGGRGDPGGAGPPGAGHAGPAAVRRRGDPGQAGRAVRGRVQVRRGPGPGAPDRGRGDRAVHPAA